MNKTRKIMVWFVVTGVSVFLVNQFMFSMPWLCRCFYDDVAYSQCDKVCGGRGECDGFAYYTWGICYMFDCYVQGYIVCANSGWQTVIFNFSNCDDCYGP